MHFFLISYWDFQEKIQTQEKSSKNEHRAMDVLQKKNNFYNNPNTTLHIVYGWKREGA